MKFFQRMSRPEGNTGFLQRLARNSAGNTAVIMAASLIPLAGFTGAAVDTARLYVVRVRLQQACDAGALAGRKMMTGTALDTAAKAQATAFFKNNFRSSWFSTTGVTFVAKDTSDGQVQGLASATVPATVMRMFGAGPTTVSVTCEARLEVPNLDVMFVLDTTGSMNTTNPGDSVTRIEGLRTAVVNFYDTLEAARSPTTQIRYGFVPYAANVNVGMLLKRDWMVDRWTYQSRIPDGVEDYTTGGTGGYYTWQNTTGWAVISGSIQTIDRAGVPENCVAPPNSGYSDNQIVVKTWTSGSDKYRTLRRTRQGSTYQAIRSGGKCTIRETKYNSYIEEVTQKEIYVPPSGGTPAKRYWWMYRPVEYDVTPLKGSRGDGLMQGGFVTAPVANNFGSRKVTWNGCIEERDTVRTTDYDPIPSDALDLDIDLIPTAGDPSTQWRPSLAGLVFARTGINSMSTPNVRTTSNYDNLQDVSSGFYSACPTAARKLAVMTKSQITTYVNSLAANGNTYHDIGMLWGLRLISPTGLFAAENTALPDVSRHVIFMTDGNTQTDIRNYEAYGLSGIDRRRTDPSRLPTNAEQDGIVESRLTALCETARRRNITVWVIAFGTSLTPLLQNCASTGRAFQANNAAELNQTFSKIAGKIAELRISQ